MSSILVKGRPIADVRRKAEASNDEEVFGPVACIVTFATEAEAIELTNNSDYGLAAGVISANTGRAVRIADELDVGMVHVNDQTVNGGPFAPFGGPRKSGNGTRIGG
ncbi:aldehyde dehydrogenase family protein, partial [Rhizobium leguminosarum]|uniref:aldehyde dehydrogenase family protein n=1 Tax=Rhizobium leguminosarum TaxID=384 RepID=UPI0021BC1280